MSDQSLSVGDPVPDLPLSDQEGKAASLREQACSFRDEHQDLAEAGACVVGASSDDVESHQRFAEKLRLVRSLRGKAGAPSSETSDAPGHGSRA